LPVTTIFEAEFTLSARRRVTSSTSGQSEAFGHFVDRSS
jgi:hypothetical protein